MRKSQNLKRLLEIYKEGGSPEFVAGRCPFCHEPFEYVLGKVRGHLPMDCPKQHKKRART